MTSLNELSIALYYLLYDATSVRCHCTVHTAQWASAFHSNDSTALHSVQCQCPMSVSLFAAAAVRNKRYVWELEWTQVRKIFS